MARYRTVVTTEQSPEEAFDYLADFANAEEWDPGVVEGSRVTQGPVGEGSRFRLVASFLGRRVPLEYRVVAFDRPRRVVLEADEASVRSTDEITVTEAPGGAEITYDADLGLKGRLAKVANPLLGLAFRRVGDRATDGLRETLNR